GRDALRGQEVGQGVCGSAEGERRLAPDDSRVAPPRIVASQREEPPEGSVGLIVEPVLERPGADRPEPVRVEDGGTGRGRVRREPGEAEEGHESRGPRGAATPPAPRLPHASRFTIHLGHSRSGAPVYNAGPSGPSESRWALSSPEGP